MAQSGGQIPTFNLFDDDKSASTSFPLSASGDAQHHEVKSVPSSLFGGTSPVPFGAYQAMNLPQPQVQPVEVDTAALFRNSAPSIFDQLHESKPQTKAPALNSSSTSLTQHPSNNVQVQSLDAVDLFANSSVSFEALISPQASRPITVPSVGANQSPQFATSFEPEVASAFGQSPEVSYLTASQLVQKPPPTLAFSGFDNPQPSEFHSRAASVPSATQPHSNQQVPQHAATIFTQVPNPPVPVQTFVPPSDPTGHKHNQQVPQSSPPYSQHSSVSSSEPYPSPASSASGSVHSNHIGPEIPFAEDNHSRQFFSNTTPSVAVTANHDSVFRTPNLAPSFMPDPISPTASVAQPPIHDESPSGSETNITPPHHEPQGQQPSPVAHQATVSPSPVPEAFPVPKVEPQRPVTPLSATRRTPTPVQRSTNKSPYPDTTDLFGGSHDQFFDSLHTDPQFAEFSDQFSQLSVAGLGFPNAHDNSHDGKAAGLTSATVPNHAPVVVAQPIPEKAASVPNAPHPNVFAEEAIPFQSRDEHPEVSVFDELLSASSSSVGSDVYHDAQQGFGQSGHFQRPELSQSANVLVFGSHSGNQYHQEPHPPHVDARRHSYYDPPPQSFVEPVQHNAPQQPFSQYGRQEMPHAPTAHYLDHRRASAPVHAIPPQAHSWSNTPQTQPQFHAPLRQSGSTSFLNPFGAPQQQPAVTPVPHNLPNFYTPPNTNTFFQPQPQPVVGARSFSHVQSGAPNTGPFFNRPHPFVSFGFGGKIVYATMNRSTPMSHIKFTSTKQILAKTKDVEIATAFPGPLSSSSSKDMVTKFIQARESSIMEAPPSPAADVKILWCILRILVANSGSLVSQEGQTSNPEKDVINNLLENFKSDTAAIYVPGAARDASADQSTLLKIQDLVVRGSLAEAQRVAVEARLWSHALVIAGQVGPDLLAQTVLAFSSAELQAGCALRTAYTVAAKQTQELNAAINSQAAQGQYSILDNWRSNVATILSMGDRRTLGDIGDQLWSFCGRVQAAHSCYLLADLQHGIVDNPNTRIVLLGADHKRNRRQFVSVESLQMSEIYEFAKSLSNSQFTVPTVLPYKLVYATRLADLGLTDVAYKYVQQLSSVVRAARQNTMSPHFVYQLETFEERLKNTLSKGLIGNTAKWFPKFINKGLNMILGADETKPNQAQVGKPTPQIPAPVQPSPSVPHSNLGTYQQPGYQTAFQVPAANSAYQPLQTYQPAATQAPVVMFQPPANQNYKPAFSNPEPFTQQQPLKPADSPPKKASEDQNYASDFSTARPAAKPAEAKASPDPKADASPKASPGGEKQGGIMSKLGGLMWRRPSSGKHVKLGEKNKFVWSEEYKMWLEEGTTPNLDVLKPPPPPMDPTPSVPQTLPGAASGGPGLGPGPGAGPSGPSEQGEGDPSAGSFNKYAASTPGKRRPRYVDPLNNDSVHNRSSFSGPSMGPPAAAPPPFKIFTPAAVPMSSEPENQLPPDTTMPPPPQSQHQPLNPPPQHHHAHFLADSNNTQS